MLYLISMSVNAPLTSAICAGLLLALLPARADAAGTLTPVPLAWQRPWSSLPKLELAAPHPLRGLDVLPDVTRSHLALTVDPRFASRWPLQSPLLPLSLEPDHAASNEAQGSTDLPLGLNLPATVPPLIRYTDETTDVTLSISPGSPCTGACLRLAGSF